MSGEATPRPWVHDPWGIWTAGGPKDGGERLFDADGATDADVILAVEAVNAYDRLRAIEAAARELADNLSEGYDHTTAKYVAALDSALDPSPPAKETPE